MKIPLTILTLVSLTAVGMARIWTSTDGNTVEAEFVSSTNTHVTIQREADRKRFTLPIEKLSEEDQAWITSNANGENSNGVELPSAVAGLVESRGSLLFEDTFDREDAEDTDDLGEAWTTNSQSRAMGDKQNDLVDGELVMTISPRADHAISTVHTTAEPYGDAVVSLRMKLEEGDQLKLAYNDRDDKSVWAGHINGVTFTTKDLRLVDERESVFKLTLRDNKETPEGKAAMDEAVASASESFPLELDPGEWHDVVTVHEGETLTVYIDGEEVGSHTSPGFGHETKRQFVFAVAKHAVVDDLKLWKLSPAAP
ncbi:MAG: hypothetical protein P1U68_03360 [Verrucomicrobiales bacterium]|nr:hypothetical protein [Verrucomicrobiales bacterium]